MSAAVADATPSAIRPTLATKSFFMTHLTPKSFGRTRMRRSPIAQTTPRYGSGSSAQARFVALVIARQPGRGQRVADHTPLTPPKFHNEKSPGPRSGAFLQLCDRVGLEAVVETRAHQIGVEVHVGRDGAASHRAVCLAEIDIEIFDLRGPRTGDRSLEAAAESPANPGVAHASETNRGCLDVAEGGAAGDEGHEAIERVADPAARSAQPGVAGLTARG